MKQVKRFFCLLLVLGLLLAFPAGCTPKRETGGVKDGRIGQTIKTYFFSFVVEEAYLCSDYAGHIPKEGMEILVARVTVTNTGNKSIPMADMDFQAQWDDESEDAFAVPITMDPATKKEIAAVSEEQLPYEYDLAPGETRSGDLVFDIPSGCSNLSVSTADTFENGTKGDSYFVFFDPDVR